MTTSNKYQQKDLIYSILTKWGLKKFDCKVSFFVEEPLNDLFFVICSILSTKNEPYNKRSLGALLGFSVLEYTNLHGVHVYYDKAEENLFLELLKKVEDEKLIIVEDDNVVLTNLGKISLKENKHYRFFHGQQFIYEHLKLNATDELALQMFPFYDDMGIYSNLIAGGQFWPNDDEIESIIYCEKTQLINRIDKQSKEIANIYTASRGEFFDIVNTQVIINLYNSESGYIPVLMKSADVVAEEITSIINNGLNDLRRENLILECLFKKIWDDPNSILNYNSLNPYLDLVDFEALSNDRRTDWLDHDLFSIIIERANQNCWKNITLNCDVSTLCDFIDQIKDYIDWSIFSQRVGNQFLIDSFLLYPWDLEVISNDYGRSVEVIEQLLALNKETDEEWDWIVLEKRLSKEFVLRHLELIDIELSNFTIDSEEIRQAILTYPQKKWNWSLIEKDFQLEFIYNNIATIGEYLTGDILFDRVFITPKWAHRFAQNQSFVSFIDNAISHNRVVSSLLLNEKNYKWYDDVINLLYSKGLICWESTPYMRGFECNPFLIWNKSFFKKYSKYISTEQGFDHVSNRIEDLSILKSNPTFSWNWEKISSNPFLSDDKELYLLYGDKLNWSVVFETVNDISFIESIEDIDCKIGNDKDAWSTFSRLSSLDFIKSHYRFDWDWKILTQRMFKNLKLDRLGNGFFIDKWDWDFLSSNLPDEYIISHLDQFSSHWNWKIIFDRILNDENRLDESYLDAIKLTLSSISDSEQRSIAWTALTSEYTFKELKELIPKTLYTNNYEWDISYFTALDDFRLFIDLPACYKFVDWDVLSSSSSLERDIVYNKKRNIQYKVWQKNLIELFDNRYYKWNFKLLSNIQYLRDQEWFISKYRNKVDWTTISSLSKVFCESDKERLNDIIEKFSSYIDFHVLSTRSDIDIQQIIKTHPNQDYNYNYLVEAGLLVPTIKKIYDTPKYDWDLYLVTSQPAFRPSAKFLKDQIQNNEKLNWGVLSKFDDSEIWSDEFLLTAIATRQEITNEIDWFSLSSRSYFPLNQELLLTLPIQKLNWKNLSQSSLKHSDLILKLLDQIVDFVDWHQVTLNPNLNVGDLAILDKYKSYLDWHVVCQRNDFIISNQIVERFADYLDWDIVSSSLSIDFSAEFVDKYEEKWNWNILVRNKAFNNKVDITKLNNHIGFNIVTFIRQFPKRPIAYHFTHLSNAVKIIKTMKLQCRNYAEGEFSNSAGSNVTITNKAHRFARFYFRPQSPTQFYNEFLGMDADNGKYYYDRALGLGLPKCPLPIFFVFDVEELLTRMPSLCFYSNGNMQKASTKYFRVIEDPSHIKAKAIYGDIKNCFHERQQEFLVDGELDFSQLSKVQIVCYNEKHRKLLVDMIGESKWIDNITIDPNLYVDKNKQLVFIEHQDSIEITTSLKEDFKFRVSYYGSQLPSIMNPENIVLHKSNNIIVKKRLEILKNVPFEVYFEVLKPRMESWLVYSNTVN